MEGPQFLFCLTPLIASGRGSTKAGPTLHYISSHDLFPSSMPYEQPSNSCAKPAEPETLHISNLGQGFKLP